MIDQFDGLGPVGRDLATVPWERTALGLPDLWPASLRTMVAALISSRFSMWMAWGPDLTFFCNDAYRRDTLGQKYPWALGRPAREVWSEIWPEIGPRIESVLRTGEATWDERLLLFLERSGYTEETYHTFSYSPLRDDDGTAVGMLCVVTEDTGQVVGQRRLDMLRNLAQALVSLRDETEVLTAAGAQLATDQASLPFTAGYLFDEAGDPRLAWTSGVEVGHALAPLVHPADGGPWPVPAVREGRAADVALDAATLGPLPTGAWAEPPLVAVVEPLTTPGSTGPTGFMVVGTNRHRPLDDGYRSFIRLVAGQVATAIAAARSYDAERRRAQQLAELDAAKTTFFTNVSHELRTPLTLIIGPLADALADTTDALEGAQRDRVQVAVRNAERLLTLVNTLLDFSRIQSGRSVGRFEPTDLAAQTAQVASMFTAAVADAGLEYRLELPELPDEVYVDREMWAKVVTNLLSNALKFTLAGSISVRLRPLDAGVELAVTDTGEGIAPADQEHLFERFHRVAGVRARSHEGSGIGLALVAELAALHGGRAAVDSTPGVGSTFTVWLPLGRDHLPAEQVHDPAEATSQVAVRPLLVPDTGRPLPAPGRPATSGAAARVLVVDDNADMRNYVAGLLAGSYAVDTATNGAEALQRAIDEPPDLVLTDVMMPELDGFGLLRALRGRPETAAVPVVFLTARAGEEGTVEGLDAGADDYLAKPFAAPELLARVRASLELDRSRHVRAALEASRDLVDQAQRLARVGSWEHDLTTGTVTGSDEYLRLLGLSPADLATRTVVDVRRKVVDPADREMVTAILDQAVRDGRPFGYDARMVGPGGRLWWGRVRGEVVKGPDGTALALRGSLQDITDQREAEQRLAAAAAAEEAAAGERRIADELQAALLPSVDLAPDDLEVATYYRAGVAGVHVGGDWYDLVDLGAGRTALVLGDVMGRGVRAAAVMGQLRSIARAYLRLGMSPGKVLDALDGDVRDLGDDHIVTCVVAVYDPADRTLTWANAGHLPPLLVDAAGDATRLAQADPPLGSGPLRCEEHREALAAGSLVALYTDGLVERRGEDIDAGVAALASVLSQVDAHLPSAPPALVDALLPDGPDDDIAILLARVPDPGRTPVVSVAHDVEPDPAAVGPARRLARTALDGWRLDDDIVEPVTLVVSELVTNAVVHGRPPIRMALHRTSEAVVVEVTDAAPSGPRRLRPTADDEHGRGVQLVDLLSTRWGTQSVIAGKTVWARFAADSGE